MTLSIAPKEKEKEKETVVPHDASQSSLNPDRHATSSSSFTILGAPATAEESIATNDLVVRFEIILVKMLLPGIHGLQFRKISGDAWQYSMLAKRVLQEFAIK